MASARTFTERVASALLSLVATGMAIGGVCLAGLGVALRQAGSDLEGMPIITSGLVSLGGILAVPGGVGVVWARMAGYSSGARAGWRNGSALAVALAAAAIPLGLATQLGPLASYWQDVLRLASEYRVWESASGPGALIAVPAAGVLLVPAVEAAAAVVLALSCGLLLVLVVARSAAAVRLTAIGALLSGGLVAGSWAGVVTTERLLPLAEAVIRDTPDPGGQEQARALTLVSQHRAVAADSAVTLAWALAAMALLALATRGARDSVVEETIDNGPQGPSLYDMDEGARAQALLDAADRLHLSLIHI